MFIYGYSCWQISKKIWVNFGKNLEGDTTCPKDIIGLKYSLIMLKDLSFLALFRSEVWWPQIVLTFVKTVLRKTYFH